VQGIEQNQLKWISFIRFILSKKDRMNKIDRMSFANLLILLKGDGQ